MDIIVIAMLIIAAAGLAWLIWYEIFVVWPAIDKCTLFDRDDKK